MLYNFLPGILQPFYFYLMKYYFASLYYFAFSIHFCLSYNQTAKGVADKFIQDIQDSVEILMSDPNAEAEGVVIDIIFKHLINYQ